MSRLSSAGYDLTRLLVGSEGTLAVITEAALKLHPLPAAVSAATCHFPDLTSAASAVAALLQCGVPVSRCELLHSSSIAAFNAYAKEVADLEVSCALSCPLIRMVAVLPATSHFPLAYCLIYDSCLLSSSR